MIPIEKVQLIVSTYERLEKELSSANIDKKEFVNKSKEYSSIGEIIKEARACVAFENENKELNKIIEDQSSDKEMVQLAENELLDLKKKRKI
jgi:peptide chain release factor 1